MLALWLLLSCFVTGIEAKTTLSEKVLLKDRIKGAIQGAALGDALGRVTTPLDTTQEIRNTYGNEGLVSFKQFKPTDWRFDTAGRKYAPWTDNTLFSNAQLTVFLEGRRRGLTTSQYGDITARSLMALTAFGKPELDVFDNMRNRRIETIVAAERLAKAVDSKTDSDWWVRPISTLHRDREIAQETGSSVLARVWPAGIAYVEDLRKAQSIARVVTEVTHRNPTVVAASAAIVAGISYAVRGASADEIVNQMARAASYHDRAEKLYKRDAKK